MTRQYLDVAFKPGGKPYCYHNDGAPVVVGDKVKVDSRDGWTAVVVVAIREGAPSFDTKPIMGSAS